MNVHGLKQKKKKLNQELHEEEQKEIVSRLKILRLRHKIKAIGEQINNKREG